MPAALGGARTEGRNRAAPHRPPAYFYSILRSFLEHHGQHVKNRVSARWNVHGELSTHRALPKALGSLGWSLTHQLVQALIRLSWLHKPLGCICLEPAFQLAQYKQKLCHTQRLPLQDQGCADTHASQEHSGRSEAADECWQTPDWTNGNLGKNGPERAELMQSK